MLRKFNIKTWLLVGACVGLGLASPAHSAVVAGTYYVAPNGNDTNPGTLALPWKTIQKAATLAGPGVTVLVRGGVYKERVNVVNSGSSQGGFVSLQNFPNETPVLDGTGLVVPNDTVGLITIEDKSYVKIMGFELRNFTTNKSTAAPAGILVRGAGSNIEIRNNYVHHITTTVNSTAGNAFGIAVYGSRAPASINKITIDGNEVAFLKTGSSESVVVNGNVENFSITRNKVHDNNNIGIDAIGYEGTAPNVKYDRARNGVISHNLVYNISSYGNPAYGNYYAADGIYVDGGTQIVIEANTVHHTDIGIEVASEHKGKLTDYITIRNNLVYQNRLVGISLGGYDSQRGGTDRCVISYNTLYQNNSLKDGSGEVMLQFYLTNNQFDHNIVVANSQGLFVSNANRSSVKPMVSNTNLYFSPLGTAQGTWQWKRATYKGLLGFNRATGNDAQSLFADPMFIDVANANFMLAANSPAIGKGVQVFTSKLK